MAFSSFVPFLFLFLATGGLFVVKRRSSVVRTRRMVDSVRWEEMTDALFERPSTGELSERLEQALNTGARKLGLAHGMVALHSGEGCVVLGLVSNEGWDPVGIRAGQPAARGQLYCGMMSESNPSLAIDFASLSEWRRHPAFRQFGWEAYLGCRVELGGGEGLTIGFFHSRPRAALFSRAEKDFVSQLAQWIAAMVQRDRSGDAATNIGESESSRETLL